MSTAVVPICRLAPEPGLEGFNDGVERGCGSASRRELLFRGLEVSRFSHLNRTLSAAVTSWLGSEMDRWAPGKADDGDPLTLAASPKNRQG